jgi:hypothetical protein
MFFRPLSPFKKFILKYIYKALLLALELCWTHACLFSVSPVFLQTPQTWYYSYNWGISGPVQPVSVSESHSPLNGARECSSAKPAVMFSDTFLFSASTASWGCRVTNSVCGLLLVQTILFHLFQDGLYTHFRVAALVSLEIWWQFGC